MQISGTLTRYGPAGPQVALVAGAAGATRAVVLVGGLTDGLLFAPYVAPLTEALSKRGWAAVHASLQSSWTGYGTGSLDRDAGDLRLLLGHLRRQHGITGVVLMGHSTGCQDAVRYTQRYCSGGSSGDGRGGGAGSAGVAGGGGGGGGDGPQGAQQAAAAAEPQEGAEVVAELLGSVLQAPVSDVEWLSSYPELGPVAARAAEMLAAGRGEEVCCRLHVADSAPMSAARFLSLYSPGGDDDMFSEGLPQQQLQRMFAAVGTRPCLLLVSGADECVPARDQIVPRAEALQAVIGPRAVLRVVAGAPHNLSGCEVEAVEAVCAFLDGLEA
ncbi:hypothetical protein HYH02_007248 [Chlamydomonas schloesseri]|uniref:Uncharacterized protein n=1 Tax=Chlamydomonas schloesseri TaxID=2026947 RepID=A0A835WI09_9CHLO|nr:hypothetical protein HYH02_007248 [Chlamydomonas schloesseri]|eukprot:KAG2447791.1 hypothetical protein HYH02_007248 [Chlamydomonas schloesseri]